jgi:hypothetical protein
MISVDKPSELEGVCLGISNSDKPVLFESIKTPQNHNSIIVGEAGKGKCYQHKAQYQDERGWLYFVRAGIGGDVFKAFYSRPGSRKEHGYRNLPWRHRFDEAQKDLVELAARKGWSQV